MNIKSIITRNTDTLFYLALRYILKDSRSVLDVGCGAHSPICRVGGRFRSTGIDIFKKSIEISKKEKNHNEHVIGDIKHLNKYFKDKSFDTVVALDVIEHLTKKQAIEMVKQMEKIARKSIVIMTPNGFYSQDKLDGNPHQVHKSGWSKNDFSKMSYRVYGLRGIKFVRGIHATIKYKPWILWGAIAFITEPILFLFPSLSYDLLAVKEIN